MLTKNVLNLYELHGLKAIISIRDILSAQPRFTQPPIHPSHVDDFVQQEEILCSLCCNTQNSCGIKLLCGHTVHCDCAKYWLAACSQCPVCGMIVQTLMQQQQEEYAVAEARDMGTINVELTRRKRLQRFDRSCS